MQECTLRAHTAQPGELSRLVWAARFLSHGRLGGELVHVEQQVAGVAAMRGLHLSFIAIAGFEECGGCLAPGAAGVALLSDGLLAGGYLLMRKQPLRWGVWG